MSVDGERLLVMVEARIAEFERRMAKAERTATDKFNGMRRSSQSATRAMERDMALATTRINQSLAAVSGTIGKLGAAFGIGLGIGAIGQLATAARGAVRSMADLADQADRIGMDVETFQGLRTGLQLSGVAAEEAGSSLETFAQRLGDAAAGQGDLYKAASRSGIAIRDQNGELRSTTDVLRDFADAVQGMDSPAERMALVTDAFGRGGKAMVLAMSEGADGIDTMIEKARESGVVIEEDMVRKAAELDDKFDMVGARIEAAFKRGVVGAAELFGLIERERENLVLVPEQAAQVIGDDLTTALAGQTEVGQASLELIESLRIEYQDLAAEAQNIVPALAEASNMMAGLGRAAEAAALADLAGDLADAASAFEEGQITGEAFAARLEEVAAGAIKTVAEMKDLDQLRLSGVTGAVQGLLDWIRELPGAAAAAREEIKTLENLGMDTVTPLSGGGNLLPPTGAEMPSSPRPRSAPSMLGEPEPAKPGGGGGGGRGGGGGGRSSQIEALLADLQTEREILDAWYEESLDLLSGATDAQLEALGGRHEAMERLEAEHIERLRDIRQTGQGGILADAETFFGEMAAAAAMGGDRMAKAARVFGALEAAANVGRAQAQVLADPTLPWWRKIPAMLSIGAVGAKVVASIKGGGSGAGGGSGGGGGGAAPAGGGRAAEGPLRVLLEGVKDGERYEGAALRRMFDALSKEAGDRGLIFAGQS